MQHRRPRGRVVRSGDTGPRLALILAFFFVAGPLLAATKSELEAQYKELVDRFEEEKGKPDFERAQTVLDFGKVPTPKTVRFLGKLFKTEKQTLWGAVTQALGTIGSVEAVRALVSDGLPRLESRKMHTVLEYALQGPWDAKAEKWLLSYGLKGKNRKNPDTYAVLVRTIAGLSSPKRLPLLAREAKSAPTSELRAFILKEIDGASDRKTTQAAAALVRAKEEAVQAAALGVLATARSSKHRRLFLQGLKSPHALVRAASIEGLGAIEDEQLVGHGTSLLVDPDPRVQVVAIRALMKKGGADVVAALVNAMADMTDRPLDDVTDALTRLTGKTFGPVPVQWESWWSVNRDKGLQFTLMSAREFSELKSEAGKGDDKITLGLYYGVRVLSERATFIIDSSKSMEEPFLGDVRTATTANTGRKKKTKDKKKRTRMRVAKRELQQLLKVLKETQHFNIFRFDSLFENFASALGQGVDTLVPPTSEFRTKAAGFVESLKPQGSTNISRVLEEAFRSQAVDTIFLLTDGGPTAGITDHQELLNILRKWNRHRRIRINTFGFQLGDEERGLLLQIAEQNYGVFVDI